MYEALFDTNILIYASDPTSNFNNKARELLRNVLEGRVNACVSTQNLYEFYAIVTDPKRVAKPLGIKQASSLLQNYIEAENLPKIFPKETNLTHLVHLIKKYKISKQEVFDAVLVATMLDNSVKTLYTADEKLFKKFTNIKVVNPFKE